MTKRLFAYLPLFALLLSCNTERVCGELEPEYGGQQLFRLSTRSGGSDNQLLAGTTLRFFAYNPSQQYNNHLLYLNDGASAKSCAYYVADAASPYVTACTIAMDGTPTAATNVNAGLNGAVGDVRMAITTPATVEYDNQGYLSYNPDADEGTPGYYRITPLMPLTLGGYGVITIDEPLREPRARIGVEFYKLNDEEIAPFTIQGSQGEEHTISIIGSGAVNEVVKYLPTDSTVHATDDARNCIMQLTEEGAAETLQVPGEQREIKYYYTPLANYVYVAAGMYDENILKGSFQLIQGVGHTNVTASLSQKLLEIKPQHTYTFKLVVTKTYINFSVDVYDDNSNDWQLPGDGIPIQIIANPETIELGVIRPESGNQWNTVPLEQVTIGGE